jgi:four helix bundle protein
MFSYEKLEVYKKAYHTNQKVYRLLKDNKIIAPFARNQLGRACMSIMLNIAEGSAKFSNRDRRNFYVTARGSVFECSSLVIFLYEEGEIIEGMKQDLCTSFEEISKMLFTMIKHLEGN